MTLRIAGTFTDGLARRTGDEQKAVTTTAFDLQKTTDQKLLASLVRDVTGGAEAARLAGSQVATIPDRPNSAATAK